jgi:hypothetical protein
VIPGIVFFTTEDTEVTGNALEDITRDSVLETLNIEMNHKTHCLLYQFHTGRKWRLVNTKNAVNAFQLTNPLIVDQQVHPVTTVKPDGFVVDWEGCLIFDSDA